MDALNQEGLVQIITTAVIKTLAGGPEQSEAPKGLFDTVDQAVAASVTAYRELQTLSLAHKGRMIDAIRTTIRAHAEELAQLEYDETGMGRIQHKVRKIHMTIDGTPGMEDIVPQVLSGDQGLTIIERRPFGVSGCIMPSTAPVCTPVHNVICMLAAGNSVVMSPHPSGKRSAIRTMHLINEAVEGAGGPANVITAAKEVSMANTTALMAHPDVLLLLATGGPGVVKQILSSGKKAIGAGPGNPPVLVDETADIPKAARDIIQGNSFENCLQCIGEKEVFVVDSVADLLISQMQLHDAYLLKTPEEIQRLTSLVTDQNGSPNKAYIGKDASYILRDMGIATDRDILTIIYEVPHDHITVLEEYLMPILPIVRVANVDEGIDLAVKSERNFRHSAMLHSRDVRNITKYSRLIATTILVKNGPSFAGVGLGGEGYAALSIAGPTGEGLTSPKTFTRPQRCVMSGELNLRGAIR